MTAAPQQLMSLGAISALLDNIEAQVVSASPKRAPLHWRERLHTVFPGYFPLPFSEPHAQLWRWVEGITAESTPRPFVAIWPRGRGKSTHAEAVAVDLGARNARHYCWYVSETQEQADKHVLSMRFMMESSAMLEYFPGVGRPKVTKTGGRTWRRNLLVADNDFAVEAIGLDKAIRGGKIESQRPDLIIFDDIDARHDTENAITKKQQTITTSILPAGAHNCAVVFCQNLIHRDSIAHRLARRPGTEGAADYLADRVISGPFVAVEGLTYEYQRQADSSLRWVITGGRSIWAGFTLEMCEAEINREGPSAFELESQHDIDADNPLALLESAILDTTRVSSHPDLFRVLVGVDPSGGAGQVGIIAGGVGKLGKDTHGYILADYSTPIGTGASDWGIAVLRCYHALDADGIVVEDNFGGDMVENTIRTAVLVDDEGNVILKGTNVYIIRVHASRGKEVRAQPVASLYQLGKLHNVGHFPELEKQWTQWEPGTKPSPDRLDACVWVATGLNLTVGDSVGVVINDIDQDIYKSKRRSIWD